MFLKTNYCALKEKNSEDNLLLVSAGWENGFNKELGFCFKYPACNTEINDNKPIIGGLI